jgi:hypothetical protein
MELASLILGFWACGMAGLSFGKILSRREKVRLEASHKVLGWIREAIRNGYAVSAIDPNAPVLTISDGDKAGDWKCDANLNFQFIGNAKEVHESPHMGKNSQ